LAAGDPTADSVQAVYQEAGLIVSSRATSTDGVVTLAIGSAPGQTTLRVDVFPSAAAALAEHQQAHLRAEAPINRAIDYSDSAGPQLAPGDGLSLWRHNLALVQAAPVDDVGAFPLEIDCGIDLSSGVSPLPRTTVAASFAAPLEALSERTTPP
jgi:hypothetical protein